VGKEPKNFDTDKHSNQYKTFLQGKANADRLLNQVLNDYPKKAYTITQGIHQFKIDAYRNGIIEIPLEVKWNYNYIVSFNEALKILEDGSNGLLTPSPGNVTVMAKDPKDWVIGTKNHYKFNDMVIPSSIRSKMQRDKPNILLSIKDFNNTITFKQCYVPDSIAGKKPAFYNLGSSLVVYGNQTEKNLIELRLTNMDEALKHVHNIELTIVDDSSCP
jgi:hypothetical protein